MKNALKLTISALIIFCIMSYWGIRSPDSEVVFRTTQSLATHGIFSVPDELSWRGFGFSQGKDGKLYSIFGPGESIAAVPLYKLSEWINSTEWYRDATRLVAKSHFIKDGLSDFIQGNTLRDPGPHALRMVVSLFNVITASLCVFVFYWIIKVLTKSDQAALLTSIPFAFGSLILPYSGTFFSELLATLFVLLSFYLIISNEELNHLSTKYRLILSGLFLGMATSAHISAILFAPFFYLYIVFENSNIARSFEKNDWYKATVFSIGLGFILALLMYFNFVRFGDIFETGRTVSSQGSFGYGEFVSPWQGLWGILLGAGKGLLLFCPVIILSLIFWLPFHRRHRVLSFAIIAAALVRIVFISSRSDWHGGFSLGPRYMVMLIPFLMFPLGEVVRKIIENRNTKAIIMFAFATFISIAQQLYFSIGEIFSFLHFAKWKGESQGINVFKDNLLYLNWDYSPLIHLLEAMRGPLLLSYFDANNYVLWLYLVIVTAILLSLIYFYTLSKISHKIEIVD